MKVGLDFDDVVVRSHLLKSVLAENLFGIKIHPKNFQKKQILDTGILTQKQYEEIIRETFSGKYPLVSVRASVKYIFLLQENGHSVRIITRRSHADNTLPPALEWFKAYNLNIHVEGVGYGLSKTEACTGLDLFVDDDIHKLIPLVGVVRNLFHFVWPFDEHERLVDGVIRVNRWDILYAEICKISQ